MNLLGPFLMLISEPYAVCMAVLSLSWRREREIDGNTNTTINQKVHSTTEHNTEFLLTFYHILGVVGYDLELNPILPPSFSDAAISKWLPLYLGELQQQLQRSFQGKETNVPLEHGGGGSNWTHASKIADTGLCRTAKQDWVPEVSYALVAPLAVRCSTLP